MLASGKVVALEEGARRAILAAVDRMAAGALRCLACVHRGDLGDLATYDGDAHPVRPLLKELGIRALTTLSMSRCLVSTVW